MPDGIYLDACALGPEKLARQMNHAIAVKRKYYDFFKWHSHYSFHSASETPKTDPICEFCALLNNVEKRRRRSIHTNTSKWWNVSAIMSNLATCTIEEPINDVILSSFIKTESKDSVKNKIFEFLPNIYYTLTFWINNILLNSYFVFYFCVIIINIKFYLRHCHITQPLCNKATSTK